MRYVIAILGFAGIVVSCLALAGRYDPPVQPIYGGEVAPSDSEPLLGATPRVDTR